MNIPRLHRLALVGSAVIALLVGFAVFLIGIFERAAATIIA